MGANWCAVDRHSPAADIQFLQKKMSLQPVQSSVLPSNIALEEHVWFSE